MVTNLRGLAVSVRATAWSRERRLAVAREHADECGDDVRVELRAGVLHELLPRDVRAERPAVRAVVRHRVVGVAAGDDPRNEWDLLTGPPVRIAGPVPALVARPHDRAHVAQQAADAREHPLALDGMGLDLASLLRSQTRRLGDELAVDLH